MTAALFFITHPDVVVDPSVPVTSWSLSDLGRRRLRAFVADGKLANVRSIHGSAERKAQEAAEVVAEHLGLTPRIVPELGENDRSSTGYLPKERFEAAADRFFSSPDEAYHGWETARAAQRRIVLAVERILLDSSPSGDIAILSHGAVGTLYKCHLKGVPITRAEDQPCQGCYYRVDRASRRLLQDWIALPETLPAGG